MKTREHRKINWDVLRIVRRSVLKRMKVDVSQRPDQVYPRTLRTAREEIAEAPGCNICILVSRG